MKNLIERYVYDVTRRLPQNIREDVGTELRSNILEMINGSNEEEEIKKVLYSMGSPRALANSYRTNKKHLISEEWMGDYLYVLKIVLIISGTIGLVFGFINAIQNYEANNIILVVLEILAMTISNIVSRLLGGFAIVTLIFICIDNFSDKKSPWRVEDLPQVPKQPSLKISRSGSIVGIVATTILGFIWVYFLYHGSFLVDFAEANENIWIIQFSIFNVDYTRIFIPFFIITILLEILVYGFKIKYTQWNLNLIILYIVSKIISLAVVITFFLGTNLLNPDFAVKLSEIISFDVDSINNFLRTFTYFIVGITILGNIIDFINLYFKQFRYL